MEEPGLPLLDDSPSPLALPFLHLRFIHGVSFIRAPVAFLCPSFPPRQRTPLGTRRSVLTTSLPQATETPVTVQRDADYAEKQAAEAKAAAEKKAEELAAEAKEVKEEVKIKAEEVSAKAGETARDLKAKAEEAGEGIRHKAVEAEKYLSEEAKKAKAWAEKEGKEIKKEGASVGRSSPCLLESGWQRLILTTISLLPQLDLPLARHHPLAAPSLCSPNLCPWVSQECAPPRAGLTSLLACFQSTSPSLASSVSRLRSSRSSGGPSTAGSSRRSPSELAPSSRSRGAS